MKDGLKQTKEGKKGKKIEGFCFCFRNVLQKVEHISDYCKEKKRKKRSHFFVFLYFLNKCPS